MAMPMGMTGSALAEAGQFLSQRLTGRTMAEARDEILHELTARRAEVDQLAAGIVEAGLAIWGGEPGRGTLIVRNSASLLADVSALAALERIRALMDGLEDRQSVV